MGSRLSISVFKEPTKDQFLQTLEDVVDQYGGKVFWNKTDPSLGKDLRTAHRNNVHSAYIDYNSSVDYLIPLAMSRVLKCPWFSLRIQEGSHWEYSFFDADKHLDSFSTLPQYWDGDKQRIAKRKGNPELISRAWNVPIDRIQNYLVNWGMVTLDDGSYTTILKDKAYDADQFDYGDCNQMEDFLNAIGGWMPMAQPKDEQDMTYHHGVYHRFVPPSVDRILKSS